MHGGKTKSVQQFCTACQINLLRANNGLTVLLAACLAFTLAVRDKTSNVAGTRECSNRGRDLRGLDRWIGLKIELMLVSMLICCSEHC